EHLAEDVAEDLGEDVVDVVVGAAAAAHAAEALAVDAGVAEAVVGGALLRVREDRVGLGDLLEPLGRFLAAAVAVRVVLHRRLAEGRLQRRVVGVPVDTQHLVVVTRHRSYAPKPAPPRTAESSPSGAVARHADFFCSSSPETSSNSASTTPS